MMRRFLAVVAAVFLTLVAALGMAVFHSTHAQADAFPSKPVKLIVPLPPGTPPDMMARLFAQQLSAQFGTVVVENQPGAGGTIGARAVAAAEPDGHVLGLGSFGSLILGPVVFRNAGYDPVRDFTPVALFASAPYLLVVSPTLPVKTAAELVDYLKKNPGRVSYGGPTGTPPHFACERFKQQTGTDIVHVPSRGGPQMIADLLGGHIQMVCSDTIDLLEQVRAGTARPLLTMTSTRLEELPDVPTAAEAGFPNLQVTVWFGLVAPKGTPATVVDRLNAAVNGALSSADVTRELRKLGAQPRPGSSDDFGRLIADEAAKWTEFVRATRLEPQ
jgi:tripartite-type tricarboxylate transporter receptor subunit TctC